MKSQDPSRNYGVDPIFARTIRQLFWWVKFAESLLLTSDRMASSRAGRLLRISKRYRDPRQFSASDRLGSKSCCEPGSRVRQRYKSRYLRKSTDFFRSCCNGKIVVLKGGEA